MTFLWRVGVEKTSVFSDFYCLPNKLALMGRSPGRGSMDGTPNLVFSLLEFCQRTAAGTNRLPAGSHSATVPPLPSTRPPRMLLQIQEHPLARNNIFLWSEACNRSLRQGKLKARVLRV